jgi:hypothetical protein
LETPLVITAVLGLVCVVAGVALIYVPAAVITGGVILTVAGLGIHFGDGQ